MNYWIRKTGSTEFLGPLSHEEIRAKLRTGAIAPDYEALEATGQSHGALKRSSDWIPLGSISQAEDSPVDQASALPGGGVTNLFLLLVGAFLLFVFGACIYWFIVSQALSH